MARHIRIPGPIFPRWQTWPAWQICRHRQGQKIQIHLSAPEYLKGGGAPREDSSHHGNGTTEAAQRKNAYVSAQHNVKLNRNLTLSATRLSRKYRRLVRRREDLGNRPLLEAKRAAKLGGRRRSEDGKLQRYPRAEGVPGKLLRIGRATVRFWGQFSSVGVQLGSGDRDSSVEAGGRGRSRQDGGDSSRTLSWSGEESSGGGGGGCSPGGDGRTTLEDPAPLCRPLAVVSPLCRPPAAYRRRLCRPHIAVASKQVRSALEVKELLSYLNPSPMCPACCPGFSLAPGM